MSVAEGGALRTARVAAIAVTLGAVVSPPLGNLAAAIVLFAFFFIPDRRARLQRALAAPLGKGALVFGSALLLAAVVGSFGPQGPNVAFAELVRWRTLILLTLVFAVFDSALWKVKFALVFVAFASFAALVSLAVLLAGWEYKDLPPGVVLRNTVTQAMTFAIAAFLACVLLVTQPRAPIRARILLAAAALLLLGLLLFLQVGRSGQVLLAVLAIVAAALLLRGGRRALAVAAVPVLAAVAFIASPLMQARFATAWHETTNAAHATEYTSMGIRVVMWQNTVELIRARPLLGYGLGGLRPAYAALVKDRAQDWKTIVTDDPHNQFLGVWVEGGLAGLLGFLFLIASALRQRAPQPWRSVAIAFLAAWCTTSMLSSHFQTFNEGHLIVVFLGAFLAPAGPDDPSVHAEASAAATAPATSS